MSIPTDVDRRPLIERLREATELLESIAADRTVLAGVPDEERARLLQAVASGVFGKAAFAGGVSMAAGGLALHFLLSFLWAGLFLLLARLRPSLALKPCLFGSLFGVLVFLGMRLVVLPLSAFPFPVTFKPVATIADLLSHMLLFGVPIALAVRRAVVAPRAA